MNNSIREQISKIFQDILGLSNQNINENTSVGDVANWDSLNHVLLISEIEKFYEFSSRKKDSIANLFQWNLKK